MSEIATTDELVALRSVGAPIAESVAEPTISNALPGLLAGGMLLTDSRAVVVVSRSVVHWHLK
ncbi:hypothetical protein NOU13_32035 [Rhodococcus erythropolis]|uniref:hypothetical protein n=1 Tax=Rhodococcus erythropolis TaxID=1833 RepID=UPI00210D8A56|nr:hypothetical protein [Rhodococcus erythropolis]MCQ4129137.1 hypothetical protein [Rhodococcus erythropolis]